MKLKICGMKRKEDIKLMNLVKPDFAGFIFYKKSHRYKTPKEARELISYLDKNIKSVGVTVNEPLSNIIDIINISNIDIIQLHGEETQEYIDILREQTDVEIWKAIRVKGKEDLEKLKLKNIDKFLLDAFNEHYGGSGKSFDHELLKDIDLSNVFIAGGVDYKNIRKLMSFNPYGIDVSSSLETDKFKDKNKIMKFMEEYNYG